MSAVWTRHRVHQQIAILKCTLSRWLDELGMPFHALTTVHQLVAVDRLRQLLVGDRELVSTLLVDLRLRMEAMPVEESVLLAMDRVATEWQDKMARARRRRDRQLRSARARLVPVGEFDAKS